jgi:toxin ParE1/3/4
MAKHNRRLIWSDDAQDDLLSIWRYGADEWSPTIADEHLEDIDHTCQLLTEAPDLGKTRDDLVIGVHSIPLAPHTIYYRLSGGGIEILRVLHEREDIRTIF